MPPVNGCGQGCAVLVTRKGGGDLGFSLWIMLRMFSFPFPLFLGRGGGADWFSYLHHRTRQSPSPPLTETNPHEHSIKSWAKLNPKLIARPKPLSPPQKKESLKISISFRISHLPSHPPFFTCSLLPSSLPPPLPPPPSPLPTTPHTRPAPTPPLSPTYSTVRLARENGKE